MALPETAQPEPAQPEPAAGEQAVAAADRSGVPHRRFGHCPFTPPFPAPLKSRASLLKRFVLGSSSWIHTLFERSYVMKLGSIALPRLKLFVLNDLQLVSQILDDAPGQYPKHELLQDMLGPVLGKGVFTANGPDWASQRAMINPAFAHTNLTKAFPAMAAASEALIAALARADMSCPVDIDPLMTHVTADIIFRTLFSLELTPAAGAAVYAAFNAYQKQAQRCTMLRLYGLPNWGFAGAAVRAAGRVRAVFEPIIRQRLSAYQVGGRAECGDILESLMAARHPETGAPFSLEELVDQSSVLFLAGHETSASVLSWAFYLLAKSPDLQTELHALIEEVAGDEALTLEHLRRLEPLRHVFKETLRLYPPVSFILRGTVRALTLRDKPVAPGDLLVISPWLIQRNPGNWACPHSFDPERFARPQDAQAVRGAWLPFGRGPRVCVGAGFAQQEAVLVLASVLREYRLSCPPGFAPELVSRLTLRPKSGMLLTFARR